MRPQYSPWGEIQHCVELCPGVYEVSTASHGGVMAKLSVASKLFSRAARQYSFVEGGYLCFEEDCEAPVTIRELIDKGLCKAPENQYYGPGEYEAAIDRSIQRYQPEYWEYRKLTMDEKSRNERSLSLPVQCFSVLPSSGELILLTRGEKGYSPCYDFSTPDAQQNREFADDLNVKNGVTKAQEAAMLAGSMFGWQTPAADPRNYDEQGQPIKPRQKDRGEAR